MCRDIVRLTNDIATCSSCRYIVCVAISFCRGIVRLPNYIYVAMSRLRLNFRVINKDS